MRILDFHLHYNGEIGEAERFAQRWREGGVEKAVVFGLNRDDGSHTTVEQVAALAERVPDFYIPFAYLNPGHGECLAQLREATSRGFVGVKLMYPAKPYDDDEYFPIYEAAAKAGMVCLFHTGIAIGRVGKGGLHGTDFQRQWRVSADYMRPMRLDRIARSFPEMSLVGAHVGTSAWYEEATSMLRWHGNVYFDMAIGQFHYEKKNTSEGRDGRVIKPRIRELYDSGQLDLSRILYGSDAVVGNPEADPGWPLRTLEFEMDGLGATAEEKDAVSWGTAARLLGLP